VLALIRFHGRGRDGIAVALKYAQLWTIDGRVATRIVGFGDWQQAVEAAGLSD
jgi:hypothetical protein